MKRSAPRSLIVIKSKDGSWSVSGAKVGQAFRTQGEAVKAAQGMLREQGGVVTVKAARGVDQSFTLGRSAMTKLNAVEGVSLGRAGQRAFAALDRADATPEQRRTTLRKDLGKLTAGIKGAASTVRAGTARSGPKG